MKWFGKNYPPPPPGVPRNPVGNVGGEIIPDRFDTSPITGYRSWHVVPSVEGAALKSLHMSYEWSNPETAKCLPQGRYTNTPDHRPEDAPHPECSCGLYAQRPDDPVFSEWETMRVGKVSVFGTIQLSGRVIICERGLKAQHATIISGHMEVSCARGHCLNPVVVVQPRLPGMTVLCWCTAHEPSEEYPLVDADFWLSTAAKVLQARYKAPFYYWSV